jgi:pyridinium-3,5-bisthiocarboxylic acid mononucleotide nickel chelatase
MNPEIYSYIFEKFFQEGALDVYLTPIMMKKNRPGTKLSLLVEKASGEKMKALIFLETTTLGIRISEVQREALQRKFIKKETPLGRVTYKEAYYQGRKVKSTPEYEDCRRLAREQKISISKVYEILNKV